MIDYDVAVFDLDGTLADSHEGIVTAMRHVFEVFGVEDRTEDPDWISGPTIYDIYGKILQTDDRGKIESAIDVFRARYVEFGLDMTTLYPGIAELIEALTARGRRLAVASLKARRFVAGILERRGVADRFDHILGTPYDDPRVPKESLIERIVSSYPGLPRSRFVYVGDTSSDIRAAHACGLRCVGALYGYGGRDELIAEGPTWTCENVAELSRLLGANGNGAPVSCRRR